MIRPTRGQYWTTLAILALATGTAAADNEQESRHLEMEVVEVVERSVSPPVSKDDYFSTLAADVNADLADELRTNLNASATTGYQLLAAELELSSGTRVVANDTDGIDGSDTEDGRTSGT